MPLLYTMPAACSTEAEDGDTIHHCGFGPVNFGCFFGWLVGCCGFFEGGMVVLCGLCTVYLFTNLFFSSIYLNRGHGYMFSFRMLGVVQKACATPEQNVTNSVTGQAKRGALAMQLQNEKVPLVLHCSGPICLRKGTSLSSSRWEYGIEKGRALPRSALGGSQVLWLMFVQFTLF